MPSPWSTNRDPRLALPFLEMPTGLLGPKTQCASATRCNPDSCRVLEGSTRWENPRLAWPLGPIRMLKGLLGPFFGFKYKRYIAGCNLGVERRLALLSSRMMAMAPLETLKGLSGPVFVLNTQTIHSRLQFGYRRG